MEAPSTEQAAEMLRRHAKLVAGRAVQYAVEAPPGCLLLASRWTPVPGWNHAIPLPGEGRTAQALLDAAEQGMEQAGIPPSLYVPDLPGWNEFRRESAVRGYRTQGADEWMVRDLLANPPTHDASPDGVTWVLPERLDQVEAFVEAFARGFEDLPLGYAQQLYLTLLADRSDRARHCGVEVDGQFVTVGSVYHDGTFALLMNVATDPAHRERGHARRSYEARVAEAARAGCRYVMFQTHPGLVARYAEAFPIQFRADILVKAAA